jgi:hypothetical protein
MSRLFQQGAGTSDQYRLTLGLSKDDEIDLHFGPRDKSIRYHVVMDEITTIVEAGLKAAQQKGRPYLMFIHGRSTSRRGKKTARSMVRGFMRSKAATPLIERRHCIQHVTVFVAKVRPLSSREPETG